ncbi:MAG: ABC transporter substrate-binding protein [Cyclobacteriaceae bacterium]|nr:ABC transporter substrate-binding protein [Cyclobacteriaceae bacterium]MCB0499916.1 ABC transporter substrate-binding protein [Cyclobacteriaceae bacterium]MCB9237266.1 ABC transporter substrate-binding protein [Flammeovirgaceae bacterium]MCO5270976.1 ABC transporter substrate-binding protein [Cyclobacteriaceae bacterium]MCW5901738.1 ABC transporter substrate-binding protein [Cyclobacteriaceae bacterium]
MVFRISQKALSHLLLPLLLLHGLTACRPTAKKQPEKAMATMEYAQGFTFRKEGASTEIELKQPYAQASAPLRYLLVPKNEKVPHHDPGIQVIRTPVDKIVCTSTSHIALLDYLNEVDKLVGFPSTELISSKKARARIDAGRVADLGMDKEMDLELLYSLHPDLVMGYSISGDMGNLNKIKQLGIPVVVNAEYLENHPLGRAEWIKYMAAFFGKEKMADSVFAFIKTEYLKAQALVEGIRSRPTVMSGILYGDAWFLPGGQNYGARVFQDAGYRYLWADNPSNGFIKLSFENVLSKGKGADYWIGVGSFRSLEGMKSAEPRYALFQSFQSKQVYTYDARTGPTGGSEYLELGYSRPDLILKDLIKIAHPDLLPGYTPYFHEKLH